uniref:Uncharacterized protein n=1 Tax=Nephromyces sp. ex Molgula occidentalis TaxID=2544991 RepID=A0A5C1H7H2_9APIC|nr:hypothetical protein [Nephromyces sp. ex Molgula occidentalis]
MILHNFKYKKIFYQKKNYLFKNNNIIKNLIPQNSKFKCLNLNFEKNKIKFLSIKGIFIKRKKNNLYIKNKNYYIKIPVSNPKIKHIQFY